MKSSRGRILAGVLTASIGCGACEVGAAEYPVRPVRIVVPSTPGGALDLLARAVGPVLMEKWKQQIVIDNRAGAGGIIGTEIVAKAAPDGHTLVVVATGFVTNPFIYRNLPYSTPADFTPITILGTAPNVLVAHSSVAVPSVQGLISLAREKPGQLTYGSSGVGSGGHLAMELLQRMARVTLIHVPYKGAGAATGAIVAGQTQFLITATGAAIPHIRSNRLRALAITGTRRSEALPEVPTVAESGLPGYSVIGWYAILGPGGMPARLVTRIYDDLVAALRRPDIAAQIRALGFDYDAIPPAEFARFIAKELATWAPVIKEAGIRAD
ncbi:MAG: tripartite tricarboxylate transporter substrate binding protein [Betaproteobacteria bacterium]|nr:tripartite tricarboxylate transporter substrate binding protein [Betaproteobacteria bacterium]